MSYFSMRSLSAGLGLSVPALSGLALSGLALSGLALQGCAAKDGAPETATPETVAWLSLGPEIPRLCLSPVPEGPRLSKGERQQLETARAALTGGSSLPDLSDLPEHPASEVLRGGRQVMAGEDEAARQTFRDLANTWTEDACLQQAAAFTSFRAGEFIYARPYMDAALALWPDEPDVGLLAAVVLVTSSKDLEGALTSLRRVAKAHPEHVATRAWLGRILARRGNYDEALPHLVAARAAGIDVVRELMPASLQEGDLATYLSVAGVAPPLPIDVRESADPVGAYKQALGIPDEGPLTVDIQTSMGAMSCELFWDKAPLTVANFVTLGRGLGPWLDPDSGQLRQDPLYTGVVFHRVIPGFMVQTGDPTGTGMGGPGYAIVDEIHPTLRFDRPGRLAMANSGPNTNGSQWFITEVPVSHLDGRHTIFGQCTEDSLAVVKAIARVPVGEADKPLADVTVQGLRFR